MTNQRIIYPGPDGTIAIILPILESGLPLEQIARKDVPAGVPYLIVDAEDIPTDRTYRAAWTADFSQPDGVGIGAAAWLEEQANANR